MKISRHVLKQVEQHLKKRRGWADNFGLQCLMLAISFLYSVPHPDLVILQMLIMLRLVILNKEQYTVGIENIDAESLSGRDRFVHLGMRSEYYRTANVYLVGWLALGISGLYSIYRWMD